MICLLKENIMTKCYGCGVILQDTDKNKEGYTQRISMGLCERCFRIKNYNDYKRLVKDNQEFYKILDKINKTNDLVLVVVDILNINSELETILKKISNDKILVLTKRDLLPKDIYEEKIRNYIHSDFVDRVVISSKNNYHLDLLMEKVRKYKTSKYVYVVGFTNAGKSSLINKIIYNYTDINRVLTTSNLPSTTLDTVQIDIDDDLSFIDTPGILDDGNILEFVSGKELKKFVPSKPIKPLVYQIKVKQTFVIEHLFCIEVEPTNDLVFYFSNQLSITRLYKDSCNLPNLEKKQISVLDKSDIVINGLGFIKVMKKANITIYAVKEIKIQVRPSLL